MTESFHIKVRDISESLDYILEHQPSVIRFGDGEMDLIAGLNIPYQVYDKELSDKLRHIIGQASSPQRLICLSDVFENRERYNSYANLFWEGHLKHYANYYRDLCKAAWYGSTFISRPYIDLVNKGQSKIYFEKLKQIWQNRDILIVEGTTSRSGVGNDLFDTAKSIQRIICPSKNSYGKVKEIEVEIEKYAENRLVLLMLGPTAKVIAYELSQKGYQCIDLGHIDSEYEWFKMGATKKVKLPNKHTAEFNLDQDIVFQDSESYNRQIVANLSDSDGEEAIVDDSEKISVLIPVYNGEKFLRECIESVLKQQYTNLEVVVVNDSSTDKTASILEELRTEDKRIKVFHKRQNEGVGAARNTALSLATGQYILFIDSDDWMDPNHIADLYQLLKETNSDVAVTNFSRFYQNSGRFDLHITDADYYQKVYTPQEWFRYQYGQPHNLSLCFTVPWCKLYKKELFDNILYPVDKHTDDDFTTWKLYLLSDKISYMHRSSYVYRVNEGSLTQVGNMATVFSAEPIVERLAILSLIGFDLASEISAYTWRAHMNRQEFLKNGEIEKYKNLNFVLEVIEKYRK